jgi:hypothetical protein
MTDKIKTGYHCVVEDSAPNLERKQSAFIRRIPNPSSYFKHDGDKKTMLEALDRHAAISKQQFSALSK